MTRMHLVASLMTPGHFRNAWRLPGRDATATYDIDHYRRLAILADEAGIDAIFLGDAPALGPVIEASPATGLDPLVLIGHLLAITDRVGGLITSSATYNSPYNLARRFQTLDVVTGGRAAVNVVTTYAPDAAGNFGLAGPLDKADRYRRAHEFLEVVTRLWDSWEPGAVIADRASGRFADRDKIHAIDHHGEFFDVTGPIPHPAGPQGRPVIVQAGGSEGGLSLGSTYADVIFTVAQTQGKAIAFRDDIRARATAAGRAADDVLVSLGVIVLVGETEQDARAREDELYTTIDVDAVARSFLAAVGLPDLDLDTVIRPEDLPDISHANGTGSDGFAVSTRALLASSPLSARQFVRTTGGVPGGGHRFVVGTPEQIADDLQGWLEAGAADGFTIMFADIAVDFERFARLVVPILIERGLFAPAEAGTTLRDRLGLPAVRQERLPAEVAG